MVAAQLSFRSWASFNAWFQLDDLAFLSRVINEPFGWDLLFAPYNSHLMPGGFLLTWINTELAPWTYWPFAAEMMALQLVADIGAVVFLVSAFGRRPGILPPLAIFLFTIFTLPADLWWAVGVNQLASLIAIFWGGWTHLRYLRTRRLRWAVATALITVAALAFQERAILVYLVYAFIALGYFAKGDLVERVREIFQRYRSGVLLHAVTALGYLTIYGAAAMEFDPGTSQDQPLAPLITEMGGRAVATGLLGGPLRWGYGSDALGVPSPYELSVWVAAGLLAYLGFVLSKSRANSKRVWWLFGAMLACQMVLVSASRSFLVGPQVGRDYRYTTEIAPVAAICLALAVMPLIGAVERVRTERRSAFLDQPARVALATLAVVGLATYSSVTYVRAWIAEDGSRQYFTNVRSDLTSASTPIPLLDAPVPARLFPGFQFGYPANMSSRLFGAWDEHVYYPDAANDRLYIASQQGHIKPVLISPVRRAAVSDNSECPYPVQRGRVSVPLDGPVLGIEWWVRITYASEDPVGMTITAGDRQHEIDALAGLHSMFFTAKGDGFDQIDFRLDDPRGDVCISELELGTPYAVGDQAPQ